VARDRQRAKQRKARRAQNPGPAPSQPRRENVPGELEHASAEVDEFEAALIEGADGEAVADADADADIDAGTDAEPVVADEADAEAYPEQLSDEDFEELEDEVDEAGLDGELEAEAEAEVDADQGAEAEPAPARARRPSRRERAAGEPTQRGAGRLLAFLRASWAELQRVQWPDRRQVAQATAVVLGFVIVAGAYLGLADRVASELVDLII
jgi:preprotein translocase subunit SecE